MVFSALHALRTLIAGDPSLADDPARLRGLLADSGVERGKIHVIILAQQAGVVSELRRQHDLPAMLTHPRLYARLRDDYFVAADAARIAVEAWAEALDLEVLPLPQAGPQPLKSPVPAPPHPALVRPGGPLANSAVAAGTSVTITRTPTVVRVVVDAAATPEQVVADLKQNPGVLAGLPVEVSGDNAAAIAALVYHGKPFMTKVSVNGEEI